MNAAPIFELLDQMCQHGPQSVRVSCDADHIEALIARVVSGEQLSATLTAEKARIRRRRGTSQGD
jgi:hypothetical protein